MLTPPALPCAPPDDSPIEGRLVRLQLFDAPRHAAGLWSSIGTNPALWSLISPGPFDTEAAFTDWLVDRAGRPDGRIYAIVDTDTGKALGQFHLLGVNTAMGTTEMGLVYGPGLARRTAGTEAFFLLADYVLGRLRYRRFEWRCGPEHTASRRAAERYGFTLEGVARQTMWTKGRSWDTAVYSLLDREWPAARDRLAVWLDPANFEADGRQKRRLSRSGSAG
jgi:RimJ/RimL family protein N-acetyltransferase